MYSHCNVGLQGHEYLVKLLLLLTAVWQALADDLLGKLATNDSLQHGRQLPISQVLVCCVLCQAFIWLGFGAGCASATGVEQCIIGYHCKVLIARALHDLRQH